MPKTFNAKPVKGLGEATTAKNGEMIVFGLQFGMPESEASSDEHFAIPCDTLPVFIAGLLDACNKAVAVRARHRGRMSSEDVEAYAYKLDNGSIGPSSAHHGEHILECQVRTPKGVALKYHIRADREGLQTLHSLLGWYLDTPAGRGERSLPAH
jgi:hypothetical protein